jgi:hypothetical protein
MAIGLSLQYLIVNAFVVSGVLFLVSRRSSALSSATAASLFVCLVLIVGPLVLRPFVISRQIVLIWVLSIVLPAVVVLGVSRLDLVQTGPWWLLLLGPLSFLMTVLIGIVVFNVLFESGRSR